MAAGWMRPRIGQRSVAPEAPRTASAEALHRRRGRELVWDTTLSGAFGGGVLAAGFGPLAAAAGMVLGGLAGYLFERRQARRSATPSA